MGTSTVAVVGAGLMGAGIAQVAATAGHDVVLHDVSTDALHRALDAARDSLARFVAKERLSADEADAALARITPTTWLADCAPAGIVVEAVTEDLGVKREVLAALDRLTAPDAVLATNTSALPIGELAVAVGDPSRVVGTHFFAPVAMMPLVELVRGERTSDATLDRAREFAEGLGKTCVVVGRDVAGFVVTRLVVAMTLEAVRLVEQGVATVEDIDTACRLGLGHRMGPFETADLSGVDLLAHTAATLREATGDDWFDVPALVTRMVDEGRLGRRTGEGFYPYP